MEQRILFTGAGRRIELLQAFRQASLPLGVSLKIIGADMVSTAPALPFCDYGRMVCSMRDEAYIPTLLDICRGDQIDLLIPTIDTDLRLLADHKAEFEAVGTRVMVSEPEMIAKCRDKNITADFFEECGLHAPRTVNYAGYTNCVEKYMAAMDCYVLPGYREGFGMAVVEAEAMGLPVIISDIPGPIDAMIPDETGILVKKADVNSLYSTMRTLRDDSS